MCGVLRQSEGDVYIKGISMSKNPVEAKRHIGFLPQNPPLHMDLTVTEEVVDFIAKKGFDKDYGARPIRRAMQTELEDVLAESVIAGEVRMGDAVEAVLEKDGEKERVVTKKFTKNV